MAHYPVCLSVTQNFETIDNECEDAFCKGYSERYFLPSGASPSPWKEITLRSPVARENPRRSDVRELPDMTSASNGGGGHGKANIVREVA